MKYRINYEHSGNEHSPDWLTVDLDAGSEEDARKKFDALGYYATEVIVAPVLPNIAGLTAAPNHSKPQP